MEDRIKQINERLARIESMIASLLAIFRKLTAKLASVLALMHRIVGQLKALGGWGAARRHHGEKCMLSIKTDRVESAEILRGIAAFAVAWFHFTRGNPAFLVAAPLWLSGSRGYLGVHLFFVISGFVIPYSLSRRKYSFPRDAFSFFIRRLVRLEPAYLCSIVLTVGLWELSARIDRTKVRYVVYSSFVPFQIGKIAELKSEKEINRLWGIKPKESVLHYIKHGSMNPPRNSYGDLVFDDRVNCEPGATTHVREDIDIAADFLVDMAIFFTSVFPDASIQIVLPSDYYGLSFDDSIFEQTLRKKFYGLLPEKYLTNSMKIIFQPPYSSIAQVCTPGGHANEDGRLWRTRNLIESMREIVPSNRAMTQ